MTKIIKGRFQTRRVGSRLHRRHVIEDQQLRDEPYSYTGKGAFPWSDERGLARLFYDRREAEAEIERIARRDPLLAPEDRFTFGLEITTFGSPELEDVERLLKDALEAGLRRARFRPERTVVDSLVAIDLDSARLRPGDDVAHEKQADHGAA